MTLSLVSIVKNEEAILERMIDSVKDIVDEFVIVDTGSTDGTKEIIAKYGEVHEIEFTNFVDSKNKALELATGDYILFMDADEVLYEGHSVIKELIKDNINAINCKITEGPKDYAVVAMEYDRIRVWKNNGKWRFKGPNVHEVITGSGDVITDYRIKVRHDHSDKSDENTSSEKYKSWAKLLLEYLHTHPDDLRCLFYLGRTYKDLNEGLLAISYYKKYLSYKNNNFIDERWQADYDIANIYYNLGEFDKVIDYCDLAESIDNRRCEHLNLKANVFYSSQKFSKAIDIYKESYKRNIPSNISLFLNPNEYKKLPLDQLVLCYFNLKEFDKAEEACENLIKLKPKDHRILNNMWWCRARTNMTIYLLLGRTPESIYGGIFNDYGVGGVETTYIELADKLAAMGHNVFLFCTTDRSHVYNDVNYIKYDEIDKYLDILPDIVITTRWKESLNLFNKSKKILWLQDANNLEAEFDFSTIDKIVVSSKWHYNYLVTLLQHRLPVNKLDIIPLGINKELIMSAYTPKRNKVMYASNPNRGLSVLGDMWEDIVRSNPELELVVAYGWDGLLSWNNSKEWIKSVNDLKASILKKFDGYNVKFLGNLSKRQLYSEMFSSKLLVYPCTFFETFCLTALEFQATGGVIITSDIGALATTVSSHNIKIEGSPNSQEYQHRFKYNVNRLLSNKDLLKQLSSQNKREIISSKTDWTDIASVWQKKMWSLM